MIKRLLAIVVIISVLVLLATPVFAIANPDSQPQVTSVFIFEDLQEDGDLGILTDYYIDYAAIPTEYATEAYMTAFIDTDGTTQLEAVAPYAYDSTDKGYGRGITWIYFTAAEVTADSISSANIALHSVWLMGNPTVESGWPGDPPKTTAGIDQWYTTGDPAVLLAIRVLYMAQQLETAWGEDLIEVTSLGNRLTANGETYFENAIPDLRIMAPNCFAITTIGQTQEDIDYTTEFGATIADGTGTLPVSPLTLTEGENTVTITGTGTFTVELESGTVGTAATDAGGATVTNSPVDLVAGTNTITVTLGGTNQFSCDVELVNTQTVLDDTIVGTAFDLTDLATEFGMTRGLLSGFVWMGITIVICWAYYGGGQALNRRYGMMAQDSGKGVLVVFDICIIGGTVLGLLPMLVGIMMAIGFGGITGYVLFYKGASY